MSKLESNRDVGEYIIFGKHERGDELEVETSNAFFELSVIEKNTILGDEEYVELVCVLKDEDYEFEADQYALYAQQVESFFMKYDIYGVFIPDDREEESVEFPIESIIPK